MPELPEVETVKSLLNPIVQGRRITNVEVRYARMIQSDKQAFVPTLIGKTIKNVTRIGKFLVFHLTDDVVLISHLRMEGKYIELMPGQPNTRYARVIFSLDNGHRLSYDDSRCFGIMKISDEGHYLDEEPLVSVGPEPFAINDIAPLFAKYQRSGKPVKEMLLDQTIMTGLGNIYADEVLFRCHIHPETPSNLITKKQLAEIVKQSIIVLNKAIESGGSTVRSYHPANGIDGNFQRELLAYGREGEPCSYCSTTLRKIRVGGRGTTYCPHCQKNVALPIVVGVTGRIAAGKSTAMAMFAEMGFETILSDRIVHELYEEKDVQEKLTKIFGKDIIVDGRVDRHAISQKISREPKRKLLLEKFVHPIVKERIIDEIKNAKGKIVFIEVPLLYEAGFEYLCDYVIAIDVKPDTQKRNLENRYGKEYDLALAINANNAFESYKRKVDFLVPNDENLESFKKRLENILKAIKR